MKSFPKPIVVVSKCIEFEPVRWDGSIIASEFVKQLKSYVDFIPVCPEVGIGLSVPRETLRIVKTADSLRLVQPATGLDYTEKMERFAASFLEDLVDVDGFILKSKSPSSAFKDARIYPSTAKVAPVGRGPGFFGATVLSRFPNKAVEDELRLLNERIREHFLVKLFTLADFREIKKSASDSKLVKFQARNKLLFTAYSQVQLHIMGRIVGDRKKNSFDKIIAEYEARLYEMLKKPPTRGSNYNVLTKAAGYFTSQLSSQEKAHFLDSAEKYKLGRLPLSAPLSILKSWVLRFDEEYLKMQTFFEPFPEKLMFLEGLTQEEKNYWT